MNEVVLRGHGVVPACGGLYGAVGEHARDACIGIGVVVFVGDALRRLNSEKLNVADGEFTRAFGCVEGPGVEALVGGERLCELRRGGGDGQYICGAIAKSYAQSEG